MKKKVKLCNQLKLPPLRDVLPPKTPLAYRRLAWRVKCAVYRFSLLDLLELLAIRVDLANPRENYFSVQSIAHYEMVYLDLVCNKNGFNQVLFHT